MIITQDYINGITRLSTHKQVRRVFDQMFGPDRTPEHDATLLDDDGWTYTLELDGDRLSIVCRDEDGYVLGPVAWAIEPAND